MADVATMVRFGIGLYLLVAALSKLFDQDSFVEALSSYNVVPTASIRFLSYARPGTESVIAAGLILGVVAPVAFALAGAALMIAFAVLVGYQVAAGNQVDCGCVTFAPHRAGWGTVSFDLVLAAVLVATVLTPSGGPVGAHFQTPVILIAIALAMTFLLISQLASTRETFESFQRLAAIDPTVRQSEEQLERDLVGELLDALGIFTRARGPRAHPL